MSRRPVGTSPRSGAPRMAPGGRMWSESPIRRPYPRVRQMGVVPVAVFSIAEARSANSFSALDPYGSGMYSGGYTSVNLSGWFAAGHDSTYILFISSATSSITPPSGWDVTVSGRSGGPNNFWYMVCTTNSVASGSTVVVGLPDLTPGWTWSPESNPNSYGAFCIGMLRMTAQIAGTLTVTSPTLRGPATTYGLVYPAAPLVGSFSVIQAMGAAQWDRFYAPYPDLGLDWSSEQGWGYGGFGGFQTGYFGQGFYTTYTNPGLSLPPSVTVYSSDATTPPELNPPPFPGAGSTPVNSEAIAFGIGWAA